MRNGRLRDELAVGALQGMLAAMPPVAVGLPLAKLFYAHHAYDWADAMLKVRRIKLRATASRISKSDHNEPR